MSIFNGKEIKKLWKSLLALNGAQSRATQNYVFAGGLPDKLKVAVTSVGAVRLTIDTSITGSQVLVQAIMDVYSGVGGQGASPMRAVLNDLDKVDETKIADPVLRDLVKDLKKRGKAACKATLQMRTEDLLNDDDV